MSPEMAGLVLVCAAYLIGSIPFGYLTARLVRGIDIREHGSRNIGATNVGRVLGSKWGLLVFAFDLLKGIFPTAVLSRWLLPAEMEGALHWQTAAGLATILGHMFPCWLGLRGGKGVATALGVVSCLAPLATAVAGGVFLLSFALWRIMSLSSMLAAGAFAVTQVVLLKPAPWASAHWSLGLFSLLVPALIIFRHRSNIGRLMRGEEPRFQAAKSE